MRRAAVKMTSRAPWQAPWAIHKEVQTTCCSGDEGEWENDQPSERQEEGGKTKERETREERQNEKLCETV